MLIFLLFGDLYILGEAEGQNCMFPCSWRNRTFEMSSGSTKIQTWKISETTLTLHYSSTSDTFECFKIVGRFLILRTPNTQSFQCFVIETHNADSFTALISYEYVGPFTNECNACDRPGSVLLNSAGNQTGPECNMPVGCTSDFWASNPIICEDNGIIEGDCSETTIPPTTPPTTPKPCKHRHP